MKYNFKIHKESKGYWAECIELEGCRTQGNNIEELKYNMSEVLNLYLAEDADSVLVFPKPKKIKSKNIIEVEVEPAVALAMSIRQERLKQGKTQTEMMRYLEIKNLSNYQRLENPKKANPEFKTLIALIKKLPHLDLAGIINSYKVKV